MSTELLTKVQMRLINEGWLYLKRMELGIPGIAQRPLHIFTDEDGVAQSSLVGGVKSLQTIPVLPWPRRDGVAVVPDDDTPRVMFMWPAIIKDEAEWSSMLAAVHNRWNADGVEALETLTVGLVDGHPRITDALALIMVHLSDCRKVFKPYTKTQAHAADISEECFQCIPQHGPGWAALASDATNTGRHVDENGKFACGPLNRPQAVLALAPFVDMAIPCGYKVRLHDRKGCGTKRQRHESRGREMWAYIKHNRLYNIAKATGVPGLPLEMGHPRRGAIHYQWKKAGVPYPPHTMTPIERLYYADGHNPTGRPVERYYVAATWVGPRIFELEDVVMEIPEGKQDWERMAWERDNRKRPPQKRAMGVKTSTR